jgi:hypothetical protein
MVASFYQAYAKFEFAMGPPKEAGRRQKEQSANVRVGSIFGPRPVLDEVRLYPKKQTHAGFTPASLQGDGDTAQISRQFHAGFDTV